MEKRPVVKKAAVGAVKKRAAVSPPRKKGKKKPPRVSCFTVLAVFTIVIIIGILGASAVIINMFSKYTRDLPPSDKLVIPMPIQKTTIYASGGEIIAELYVENREFANAREIPPNLGLAFIAIEDERFYKHRGVDFEGLMRIGFNFVTTGKPRGGGSTITQQLARHVFLKQEMNAGGKFNQTLQRTGKEWVLAMSLEQKYSKEEILTHYMNLIYFGESAHGVKSAAQVFFGKKLNELTLEECALLAAVPNAPSIYSPFTRPDNAMRRRNTVLQKMRELNFITEGEYQKAIAKPIKVIKREGPAYDSYKAPYFVTYVIDNIEQELDIPADILFQGGYHVYTTLDLKANQAAEEAITYGMKMVREKNANITQGSIVSIEPQTGRIIAMVGGVDFRKSKFNRAWQALRQPGSSFKPFVYMTALKKGFSMESIVNDSPACFPAFPKPYCPKNFDNKYWGPMTFHRAMMFSRNVPAVKVGRMVGTKAIIETAQSLGITSPMHAVPSLPLGACEVSILEMTAAYSGIANMGRKVTPIAVERIEDSKGNIVYENHYKPGLKVLEDNVVARIIPVMEDVIKAGTGTKANIGRPAGGKTGTTSDFRDAWFIGYVPQLATAVWFGNDDNSPLRTKVHGKPTGLGITGGGIPAPVWAFYMKKVLKNKPIKDFDLPEETPMKVSSVEGRRATGTQAMPSGKHDFIEPKTMDFTNQENPPADQQPPAQDQNPIDKSQSGGDDELF